MYVYQMARRTKAEMEVLDLKIRPLYERGVGCRIIGEVLGENPAVVFKRVRKMGILRSKDEARIAPVVEVPFTKEPSPDNLRMAAIGMATDWFLKRGYLVSIPVEPAKYDLVVESDEGFQRVQVKTTTVQDPYGRWTAGCHRHEYQQEVEPTASGKFRKIAYGKGDIDFFFIVTGDEDCYLIPLGATNRALSLTLDKKYAAYKVG